MTSFGALVLIEPEAGDLGASRVFANAQYLLRRALERPIPATARLGRLDNAFVARARDEMHWRPRPAGDVEFVAPIVEEVDLPELHLLRVALENGKLLRNYRGAFHATSRARALLEEGREGVFFGELFAAYFRSTDLAAFDGFPSDPHLQAALPRALHELLRNETALDSTPLVVGRLALLVPDDPEHWPPQPQCTGFDYLCAALIQRLLVPLADFGLVGGERCAGAEPPYRDAALCEVFATPLLRRAFVPAATLN